MRYLTHMDTYIQLSEGTQEITVVPARQQREAVCIFIHGLGQTFVSWRLVVIEAFAPSLPHVEWILPQAPTRPVSLNQGQRRPSWFDISRLPPLADEFDESTISESMSSIENIILSQVHRGVDPRKIILMGFSQGAALSMMVALTTLHELGGVISLSGWLPPLARQAIHTPPTFPILWCHGITDMEIPISLAEDAITFLSSLSIPESNLRFITYEGLDHSINDLELDDVLSWLTRVLEPSLSPNL